MTAAKAGAACTTAPVVSVPATVKAASSVFAVRLGQLTVVKLPALVQVSLSCVPTIALIAMKTINQFGRSAHCVQAMAY
ncbi:hypothetical protein A5746_12985 [Mycolicibacterium conceptionense]|nr:hypothetical protein A5746_12985 [Mycolicibacterium conceptionense]